MKIFVEPRAFIEKQMDKNPDWYLEKWIISIFSKGDHSPVPERYNVLQLEFDDVSEKDFESCKDKCIFFNEEHAKEIHEFINKIPADSKKMFFVHCDAGVSRSGAVGYILNEWFNKYKMHNNLDNEAFIMNNRHILPNPLVVRLLKNELWGKPKFANIEVNDYEYNEDGERIDNIEKI